MNMDVSVIWICKFKGKMLCHISPPFLFVNVDNIG